MSLQKIDRQSFKHHMKTDKRKKPSLIVRSHKKTIFAIDGKLQSRKIFDLYQVMRDIMRSYK